MRSEGRSGEQEYSLLFIVCYKLLYFVINYYLTYMQTEATEAAAEYIMRNAGLEEAQLESRLWGEISITSDMQITQPLWQKVKRN